jgi:hypothetical protein
MRRFQVSGFKVQVAEALETWNLKPEIPLVP